MRTENQISVPTVPDRAEAATAQSVFDRAVCPIGPRSHTAGHNLEPQRAHGTVENRHSQTWLAQKIETGRRAARPRTCHCGTNLLVGPDHDTVAATARADAQPVTPLLEAVALLNGLGSYDLVNGNLYRREPWHYQHASHPHPIHLEHRCPTTTEGWLF